MRIISGEWRGRPLIVPKGDTMRPTADRTRETLFSMLLSRIGSFEGLAVADLFAGSGALGFEALSRGAQSCLFVDQDHNSVAAIRANSEKLEVVPDIRSTSVLALGSAVKPLDILFMDPPYGSGAGSVALDKLSRLGWTGPSTWVSIETDRKEVIEMKGLVVDATRGSGRARLHLLRVEASSD